VLVALVSSTIILFCLQTLGNGTIGVALRILLYGIICLFSWILVLCFYSVFPFFGFALLWLSKKTLRIRGYYPGLGALLVLLGFALQFMATFLK
jgi:hypothetical protein